MWPWTHLCLIRINQFTVYGYVLAKKFMVSRHSILLIYQNSHMVWCKPAQIFCCLTEFGLKIKCWTFCCHTCISNFITALALIGLYLNFRWEYLLSSYLLMKFSHRRLAILYRPVQKDVEVIFMLSYKDCDDSISYLVYSCGTFSCQQVKRNKR